MKKIIFLSAFALASLGGAKAQTNPVITSWLQNTTATGYGGYTSNVQLVQYNATYAYVSTGAIPEYPIGPWPSNPNVPSPQNFVCEFPLHPVQNTGTPVFTGLGNIGLWSNGVAIFNPKDGQYWNNATSSFTMGTTTSGWNRNALVYEGVSFDTCLGHPAPGGCYHNHVNPKCLYNDKDSTHHSPIIGYAYDGFPVYGAYGYGNPSAAGAVRRMKTSYVLSTATTRTAGPPVNATYPLGNMCEDYVFTAGAGDLDAHNGRFCVTPEYPGGIYAYFVTIDASLNPVYPFVLGPTYYGVVGSASPHVTPTGPDTTYTPSTSGVKPVINNNIFYQVAPNPVQDFAYIYMDAQNMNNVKCSLFNNQGQFIKSIEFMQPTVAYALDMSDLAEGNYYLIFEGGNRKVTEKIVKVK